MEAGDFGPDSGVSVTITLLFSLFSAKKSTSPDIALSCTLLPSAENRRYTAFMEERTIFHRIRDREIPSDVVYEDADVFAFKDIHPKATTHILFIPKQFVASIADVMPETAHIPGMLILKAQQFAKEKGITGYKLTFHVGKGGGQEVMYLHLHLMSDTKI